MKSIMKITTCLLLVIMLVNFGFAQKTKTARGYYCGGLFGSSGVGESCIQTKNGKLCFGDYVGKYGVTRIGFKKKGSDSIGAEYIVYLVLDNPLINYYAATKIVFTGKINRNIKRCQMI